MIRRSALLCIVGIGWAQQSDTTSVLELPNAKIRGARTVIPEAPPEEAIDSAALARTADSLRQIFIADSIRNGRVWSGSIALNGVRTIAAGDTLWIEAGTKVDFADGGSGLMVLGTLIAKGAPEQPVSMTGGRGILVAKGGKASLSSTNIRKASSGLFVKGGEAIAYQSSFDGIGGAALRVRDGQLSVSRSSIEHSLVSIWVETGALQMEDSRIASTPVALRAGDSSVAHFEDTHVFADTLWQVSPTARVSMHDMIFDLPVRSGMVTLSSSLEIDSASLPKPSKPVKPWNIQVGGSVGRRIAQGHDSPDMDVSRFPFYLSRSLPGGFRVGLQSGWLIATSDKRTQFSDRDDSQLLLSWRHRSGLELAANAGKGSNRVEWTQERARIAVTLIDEAFDLDQPFSLPCYSAGGRLGYHGPFAFGSTANVGMGGLLRSAVDSIDPGDIAFLWLSVNRSSTKRVLDMDMQGLVLAPDEVNSVKLDWHWQGRADFSLRSLREKSEQATQIGLTLRDEKYVAASAETARLFRIGTVWVGPAAGALMARDDSQLSAAGGLGGKLRLGFAEDWEITSNGWARQHLDRNGNRWLGGDFALQLQGTFQ